ncbi:hypothetical protein [Methylobacter luteus]|uniref:hypothetical protein n=1 Tax=Methylobacter luteus TaxID=415 RepID=UPI001E59D4EF|nr:hypothetical protein [Methylobacter luteus]
MQVFQTAGEPPSKGNKIFPNMGCRTNISEALINNVAANKNIRDKLRSVFVSEWLRILKIALWAYCYKCANDKAFAMLRDKQRQ